MSVQVQVILVIYTLVPFIFCAIKTWAPTTSFYLNTNYKDNILPCSHQEVVFALSLFPPLLLDSETSVKGLILPQNGEIQFGRGGEVEFGESETLEDSRTCSNSNYSTFIGQTRLHWLQSNSWMLEHENKAVPDAERIPCQYDQVVISENSTYYIALPDVTQKVQSLKLGDQEIDQRSFFTKALGGSENTQTFALNANDETGVSINPAGCTSRAGCVCQENMDEKILCMGQVCLEPECQDPIKPRGHCCNICGAIILKKINENTFNFDDFSETVKGVARDYGADKTIALHVGRVHNNFVQVVAVENGKYDGSSSELMLAMSNIIKDGSYQLLLTSGPPKGKEWHGFVVASLTFVVIATIFGGIFLWYHTPNWRMNRPHMLAHFRHRALSKDSDISLQQDPAFEATFHNPLYSSQRDSKRRAERRVSTSSISSSFARMSTLLSRSRETQ